MMEACHLIPGATGRPATSAMPAALSGYLSRPICLRTTSSCGNSHLSYEQSVRADALAGRCSAPPLSAVAAPQPYGAQRLLVALLLDVERSSADANISDFGDAIWWAVTTMTTVGYGDHYPVTGIGRVVAFGLMLGGIAPLAQARQPWRPG
jgi:hypothetical protein